MSPVVSGAPSLGLIDVPRQVDGDLLTRSVRHAIVSQVFPEQQRKPAFMESLTRCVRGNVEAIVDIASGRMAPEEPDPRHALAFAGMVAELGIPFGVLERAYWVGVERFLQEWLTVAQRMAEEGRGRLGDLLGESTAAAFPYVMRVLDLVGEEYDAIARERLRSGEDRKRELVDQLLDGAVAEQRQEWDNILGYRLRGSHVALLCDTDDTAFVRRALTRVGEQTGAWGCLVVARGELRCAAWLGYPKPPDSERIRSLRRALTGFPGPVALGGPAAGVAGLRRAHEEALRAAEVRSVVDIATNPLWYRDVRLEAFLLGDPAAARRFVAEELGELAEENERMRRIRDTVLTSLATGSYARAAGELGVHENTVRLRIRSATEVLGDALTERRTELLVALRLRQALGACGSPTSAANPAAATALG